MKLDKILVTALLTSFIALSIGCTTPTLLSLVNLYPHDDGNKWTYTIITTTESGTTTATMEVTVNGTTTLFGTIEVWNFDTVFSTGPSDRSYYRINNSGVYYHGTPSYYYAEPMITYLVFPLDVGSTWNYAGSSIATVLARESVTVPAGTFNCYKVGYDFPAYIAAYTWYGENAGIVKQMWLYENASQLKELTSKNF